MTNLLDDPMISGLYRGYLAQAINRFGPAVHGRPVRSIVYKGDIPECTHLNETDLEIRLTESARQNRQQQKIQLSHEAVHVICRGPNTTARLIEEGTAVHFSMTVRPYEAGYLKKVIDWGLPPQFLVAADLYRKLISTRRDAVKHIRTKQALVLDELTTDQLADAIPALGATDREALLLPLSDWQIAVQQGWADLESGRAALRQWAR